MDEAVLLKYNQKGLIPGPKESEADFLARAAAAFTLKKDLFKGLYPLELPFIAVEKPFKEELSLKDIYAATQKLFDIKPSWVPIFYSNYKLAPWHGGCSWIFQSQANASRQAFLQVRKEPSFFYQREEIIAHEMAHIGRVAFDEPLFEEVLAYRTSAHKWRRWLSPIVQTGFGSAFFVGLLALIMTLDMYLFFTEHYELMKAALWLKMLPVALIFYAFGRLLWVQRVFKRCLRHIKRSVKSDDKANAVIYRLTDAEICLFASKEPPFIQHYAKSQKAHSLRWQLIDLAYL